MSSAKDFPHSLVMSFKPDATTDPVAGAAATFHARFPAESSEGQQRSCGGSENYLSTSQQPLRHHALTLPRRYSHHLGLAYPTSTDDGVRSSLPTPVEQLSPAAVGMVWPLVHDGHATRLPEPAPALLTHHLNSWPAFGKEAQCPAHLAPTLGLHAQSQTTVASGPPVATHGNSDLHSVAIQPQGAVQPSVISPFQPPRWALAGSLDPNTGIFYRTPEHPRQRTAQACEKCRTRKAKVSSSLAFGIETPHLNWLHFFFDNVHNPRVFGRHETVQRLVPFMSEVP
jgi:hypothetical protein